ncbi:Methyltransferase, FkbM family domain protein [Sphingomonas sp. T1]|uniref:FkbM family methyltransferase n=1 Tax=Sphingomonas sp. T1 TaxID=2653172 RepID=UPI0012F0CD88|nr:FkbM family methyltransferase [Sphingomonas sp. T1]VXD00783.1 Methyltransferase, FkbM family domain protein [Sphingomonas sp. T1]
MLQWSRRKAELKRRLLPIRLALQGKDYQIQEVTTLRKFVATFNIDCIIDIGANIGQYGRMLRQEVGYTGLILSFEPNPECLAKARAAAAGDDKWFVFDQAVSDADSSKAFSIMANPEFSSFELPDPDQPKLFDTHNDVVRQVQVDAVRLDTLFPRLQKRYGFQRPFLKMDTQGHDHVVLAGAEAVLDQFIGLQSEMPVHRLYAGSMTMPEMLALITSRGFRPSAFVPSNSGHFPLLMDIDGLFVRNDLCAQS